MRNFFLTILLFGMLFGMLSCTKEPAQATIYAAEQGQDEQLQLNQIQVIASHNSYRLRTRDSVLILLNGLYQSGVLPANLNPRGLDYTHLPIDQQLSNYGVRGLEIDIYNDPQGGAFANRKINEFIQAPLASGIPALDAVDDPVDVVR